MAHNFLISWLESLNEAAVAGEKHNHLDASNASYAPTS